ncbi:hypothetical protein TRFO_04894 [Tritrichomonas foetus]|uniref:TOG domain-containing protein n=1 Tax=Tritrichomonas foetus TaxID=1144522 RepID=A0A1J4KA21_9EUKA|nr:hypothetical protein TRFO_04894 [Tritrichomonas foetus]|eukprot:OHT08289.1 hypothetical protein TRFO_04894 [Tritrichomonas foetus]
MTSIDQPIASRPPPSKNSLHFGFIPQSVVVRFQASDYQQRVDASSELLELIRNSDLVDVDIHSLLMFIEPFSCDQNYLIAQNVAQLLTALVNQIVIQGLTCAPFLHQLIHIVLLQFEDRRRTVCQLGQTILVDLLSTNDHYAVISELVRSSSTPSANVSVEIFRCFTNLITQEILDPNILLQFPFYFDTMLLSPLKNVRQAVLWCVDYLKNNHMSAYNTLASLMSREASAVLGKGPGNPTTAVAKSRVDSIVVNRVLNTAGQVEAAKAKAAMNFTRTMPLSRNQYQRPSLPSGKGARQINILASMSRPVSSKSNNTFADDDQPPNFISIDEEPHHNKNNFSKTLNLPKNLANTILSEQIDDSNNFNYENEYNQNNSYYKEDIPLPTLTESENSSRPYVTEVAQAKSKKNSPPPRKRLITFDASVFPAKDEDSENMPTKNRRSKTEMRHISFAQTSPAPVPLPVTSDDGGGSGGLDSDRPIKASGFYNIGDNIDFSDVQMPSGQPSSVKKKKPQFSMTVKRSQHNKPSKPPSRPQKSALEINPKPKTATISSIMSKLKSTEWNEQNDAITDLINSTDNLIQPICENLRDLISSLLDCSASLRSMLSKNALNCLLKMIKTKAIDFEPISDMCAASLLQLLSVHKSKHFIFDLSGECFVALIDNISVSKGVDILKNEHKRKHDDARVKVALCMSNIVPRLSDTSTLLKPLVVLVQDRNPDVRKYAKLAVAAIRQKSGNFDQLLAGNLVNDEDRLTLQGI